jgi:hypothetical protein
MQAIIKIAKEIRNTLRTAQKFELPEEYQPPYAPHPPKLVPFGKGFGLIVDDDAIHAVQNAIDKLIPFGDATWYMPQTEGDPSELYFRNKELLETAIRKLQHEDIEGWKIAASKIKHAQEFELPEKYTQELPRIQELKEAVADELGERFVPILEYIAKEENEDLEDLLMEAEEGYYPQSVKTDNWMMFADSDDAESAAIEYVTNTIQSEPELLNQSWLLGHIDTDACENYFRDMYNESNYEYVHDLDDERLEDEMKDAGVTTKDDLVEYMTDWQIDEGEGGLTHYRDNFGEEEAAKIVVDNNFIDVDAAARDAVNIDGWAHFLSGYSGDYTETPEYGVYFPTG